MHMQLENDEISLIKKEEITTRTRVEDENIFLFRPLKLKKSLGRCMILAPEEDKNNKTDNALLKALVRAHLWKQQIEKGIYATNRELCSTVNIRHIQRILRLNYLAPEIKADILNGTQPRHLRLADLKKMPLLWSEQIKIFYGEAG